MWRLCRGALFVEHVRCAAHNPFVDGRMRVAAAAAVFVRVHRLRTTILLQFFRLKCSTTEDLCLSLLTSHLPHVVTCCRLRVLRRAVYRICKASSLQSRLRTPLLNPLPALHHWRGPSWWSDQCQFLYIVGMFFPRVGPTHNDISTYSHHSLLLNLLFTYIR